MTFSIVVRRAIPSASAPRRDAAKEKHVPFLSIKQPGGGGRGGQTMSGHYRLPGCRARYSPFILTPVSQAARPLRRTRGFALPLSLAYVTGERCARRERRGGRGWI